MEQPSPFSVSRSFSFAVALADDNADELAFNMSLICFAHSLVLIDAERSTGHDAGD